MMVCVLRFTLIYFAKDEMVALGIKKNLAGLSQKVGFTTFYAPGPAWKGRGKNQ
jgi:hypothetical protein